MIGYEFSRSFKFFVVVFCIVVLALVGFLKNKADAKHHQAELEKRANLFLTISVEKSNIVGAFGDTAEMDRFLVSAFGSVEEGKKWVSIVHLFDGPMNHEVYYVILEKKAPK